MASAYIYMECPLSSKTVTLGKLTIEKGVGTFVYSPEAISEGFWVPDAVHYPLSGKRIKRNSSWMKSLGGLRS
ncbi:hypothetical protein RRX38_16875 [Pseudomonas sp. DTU_2021_1001937_2_SI_NGA_ILE_001]|uniref:hypothetical protein n=1 Tax=Pseudomonas sp. DTU_2021_1001937_2_SI_NGA_ILE_001 TaxID=3077589 RepID=UPI0028FC2974|nr:hypothetical protein [Pseudomonas sp. DTU_2021_1001937_2_SI_NGA_ILE_001]WNW12752.1 hypothetical protein RRX38_16875 [Pseudomonas sp. DTU_2021_1001937_2_SI_NGA_ILE_001]